MLCPPLHLVKFKHLVSLGDSPDFSTQLVLFSFKISVVMNSACLPRYQLNPFFASPKLSSFPEEGKSFT